MIIDKTSMPKSSFLSMEKDMGLIIEKIMANRRLQKLLYYTGRDALEKPNLDQKQIQSLFENNIKIVPKLKVDKDVYNYLFVSFDNFVANNTNPEFRDNTVEFDVICHLDNWNLKDYELRPYRIAAELDSMLDKKRLTGIGLLEFVGASSIILTDEFAGLCLMYKAIHGEEDKKHIPDPVAEEQFVEDFKDMVEKGGIAHNNLHGL